MNILGDPAAIDALAATLDRSAAQLAATGRRLRHRAEIASWSCARADRFRHQMADRQRNAESLAVDFQALASDLRRSAAHVRAEYQFLAGVERKVRGLIRDFVPVAGIAPPWIGSIWGPANLPPPGDPRWHDVARALGVR
jgi:uncharacterized protein YukE